MSAIELISQMSSTVASDGDSDQHKAILTALSKLPKPPDDLLRLFDRGTHYSLHGRDAHVVADEYFKSSSCVRFSGEDRSPYLSINKTMGAEIIRSALMTQRRRIEVYSAAGGGWSLERRGSPGNLQAFEEECLRDGDLATDTSPVIVAVRLGRTGAKPNGGGQATLVGLAFVDCTVRSLRVSEFEDDEHLSTLESMLCQQGTRECLLPAEQTEADAARLKEVLELCEVPSTDAKRSTFVTKEAEADLRKLLGAGELERSGQALLESDNPQQLALSSACGLLKYLDLMGTKETHGLWSLDWVDAAQYMRLDSGAMRALSVDPQPNDCDKNASLSGLFSVCKTKVGARAMRRWLRQPLLSRVDLEERYDLVDAFIKGYETRSLLRDEVLPRLGGDLDKLGRAFAAKKATLKEVVLLYYFVLGLPKLLNTLRKHESEASAEEAAIALIKRRFTGPVEGVYTNFTNLVRLVHAAVDLEAAGLHEYKLQPHFSPKLAEIHSQQEEVREAIETHHKKLMKTLGMDEQTLRLELDAKYGYCLRLTRKDENELRKHKKYKELKLNLLQTKKDGMLFHDNLLASRAEEYMELAKQFNDEQRTLVAKVVETCGTFGPVIEETHTLVAELDVLLAFSHVSTASPEPYVRPSLVPPEDPKQRIVLRGCRHPCVERMDGVGYIKNDIELVRGESSLQVVTGPNMGGKSTYIRSAGVSVLLAQMGCFVPCDEAEISPVDCILARVGAGDNQSRGVSTFMAEMLETSTILKGATEASLVIIDELGRGTSTYDGFGLAWAIADHLATKVGCACLFATHFHELTSMADEMKCVVNRHVSAHIEDGEMTMLYKVTDGPSDSSFGIHVAEVCKFPEEVLENAKRKLAELGDTSYYEGCGAPSTGDNSLSKKMRSTLSAATLDPAERAGAMEEVRDFLEGFKALPLDTMASHEEMRAAVLDLAAKKLQGSTHPVVQSLLAAGGVPGTSSSPVTSQGAGSKRRMSDTPP